MTAAEKSALIGLICEYIGESTKPQSQLSQTFCVVDEPDAPDANTFTPWQLLEVVQSQPTSPQQTQQAQTPPISLEIEYRHSDYGEDAGGYAVLRFNGKWIGRVTDVEAANEMIAAIKWRG